jgi:hypothetical protein
VVGGGTTASGPGARGRVGATLEIAADLQEAYPLRPFFAQRERIESAVRRAELGRETEAEARKRRDARRERCPRVVRRCER